MLLTVCQNTFQSMVELEEVDSLRVEVRECYAEITRTSEQIQSTVRENYLSKDDLTTIQQDFQTAITQAASEIRMDFTTLTNEITNNVSGNYSLIDNEGLSFLENGQTIAYITNQSLVITNAEIRNRLSLGTAARGWFDFIPRETGNLSIQWRDPTA